MTVNGLAVGQSPPASAPVTQPAPQPPPLESQAHAALMAIAHRYNEHHDRVDRNAIDPLTGRTELTPALQNAHAEFASSDDAQVIDTVERLVAENVAEKKRTRDEIRKSLVMRGDTAAEIRATRRWESDRGLLESHGGSLQVGRQLLEAADDTELSVLVEQLPKFYAARGIDATEVIEAAVAKKCPALAQADSDVRRAERNATVLNNDAAKLRAGIGSGCRIRPESLVDPKVLR